MSGWEVGDLALAVGQGASSCLCPSDPNAEIGKGGIYTVIGIGCGQCEAGDSILLAGTDNFDEDGGPVGWCCGAFRKILPDAHDACESEFVDLLKRSKVPAIAIEAATAAETPQSDSVHESAGRQASPTLRCPQPSGEGM